MTGFYENIWDEAFRQAKIAGDKGEIPVGAVVVDAKGTILTSAHNETRFRHDPTAHAEILALREAAQKMKSERLVDCDLFVTLEPCTLCAAAISFFRVRHLYFAALDEKMGAVENGMRFFNTPTCLHTPEVYGGIRATEAQTMLQDFFVKLRA